MVLSRNWKLRSGFEALCCWKRGVAFGDRWTPWVKWASNRTKIQVGAGVLSICNRKMELRHVHRIKFWTPQIAGLLYDMLYTSPLPAADNTYSTAGTLEPKKASTSVSLNFPIMALMESMVVWPSATCKMAYTISPRPTRPILSFFFIVRFGWRQTIPVSWINRLIE